MTVRQHVHQRRRELGLTAGQAFVPQVHAPARTAEVDWGEAGVDLAGARTKVHVFHMRSSFSGAAFFGPTNGVRSDRRHAARTTLEQLADDRARRHTRSKTNAASSSGRRWSKTPARINTSHEDRRWRRRWAATAGFHARAVSARENLIEHGREVTAAVIRARHSLRSSEGRTRPHPPPRTRTTTHPSTDARHPPVGDCPDRRPPADRRFGAGSRRGFARQKRRSPTTRTVR